MEYIILVLIIIIVLLIVVLRTKKIEGAETKNASSLDGIRRENAKNREPIESRQELFSSKYTTRNRRFYVDVQEGADGRIFMQLSELKKVTPTNEIAYTLIFYKNEFEGFKNAFDRSYGFVKRMDKR